MEVASALLTLLVFLTSLYSYFIIRRRFKKAPTHGFRAFPFVGVLPDLILNRHRFLDWATGILAGCPANTAIFRRYGKIHGVITANPEVVEHIVKANFENYPKGHLFRGLLADFLGTGIFNADDELWRIQRKTASYEFNTKSLRNFVLENATFELKERLIPVLDAASKADDRVLDLQDVLERFTFDNICKVAFNYDPGCLGGDGSMGAEFMKAFDNAAILSVGRFMTAFQFSIAIKKFLNVGSERKLRESIAIVHKFSENIIQKRLEEKSSEKKDEDLLSRFIGKDDNSAQHLRDIVISFILAGRDTTSAALTWFFWLVSSRPDVEGKILQELDTIRRKNGRSIVGDIYTFEELREMHYLHAAITESMRLYPPVPAETKFCKEDDILPDGTFIAKDWFISYYAYAMGRMVSVWGKDCLEYKPERWIEDGIFKQVSPFKYTAFHAGPRMCLGKDMAYIQMKSVAASVLERFSIDVAFEKGKSPEQLMSLTLRMKGGLPVRVKERAR